MRAGSLLAAFSCGQQTSDFIEGPRIGQTQAVTLCCDEILPDPFSATLWPFSGSSAIWDFLCEIRIPESAFADRTVLPCTG
jgi:hypothetical protein